MKRFSHFSLAEVDIGIYSDEVRIDIVAYDNGLRYPLAILHDPASARDDGLCVAVEFGDQNWGTHYGALEAISTTQEELSITLSGPQAPVPWLATNVTYEWTRIAAGKDLIFATLRFLCSRDGIPYTEAAQ